MPIKYPIAAVVVMVLLTAVYMVVVHGIYPELSDRAHFGSFFSGVDAIFSGLAFIGIVYTIYLQKKELELQRKELVATREELTRTAEAQEKSERALTKQAESLKITAKLNGLSSLLQFELAKPDTIDRLDKNPWEGNPFDVNEAERIRSEILDIVDSKR